MVTETRNMTSMYQKLRKRLNEIIKMDRHSPYFMTEASKLADKIAWATRWHSVSWEESQELITDMTSVFEGQI